MDAFRALLDDFHFQLSSGNVATINTRDLVKTEKLIESIIDCVSSVDNSLLEFNQEELLTVMKPPRTAPRLSLEVVEMIFFFYEIHLSKRCRII